MDVLKKRNIPVETGCCFCAKYESTLYLFWDCLLISTLVFSIIAIRWEDWNYKSPTDLVRNILE